MRRVRTGFSAGGAFFAGALFCAPILIIRGGKMFDWYLHAFKHYAQFSGRAGRPEFWWFMLCDILACVVLGTLDGVFFGGVTVFSGAYVLFSFIPRLAVCARRLHDMGHSALWMLLYFVPFGALVVLIMCALPTSFPNEFGEGPSPLDR